MKGIDIKKKFLDANNKLVIIIIIFIINAF